MCMVNGFTNHVLSVASILGLFIISIDRYISIFYPLRYADYMTSKRAVILIACTWSYALITAILPLVGWARYSFVKGIWLCVTDFKASFTFSYFIIFSVYAIPLTIMTVIYYRIFKIAYHHARAIEQQACLPSEGDTLKAYPTIKDWLREATPNALVGTRSENTDNNGPLVSESSNLTLNSPMSLHNGKKQAWSDTEYQSFNNINKSRPRLLSMQPDAGESNGAKMARPRMQSLQPQQNSTRQATPNQIRRKRKLHKFKKEIRTGLILSVIVIIFVVSWSPFAILNLWALHTGKKTSIASEAIVSRLAYTNSAINPPLYCLMNKVIRRSMKKLWHRVFKFLRMERCFKWLESNDNEISMYEMTHK